MNIKRNEAKKEMMAKVVATLAVLPFLCNSEYLCSIGCKKKMVPAFGVKSGLDKIRMYIQIFRHFLTVEVVKIVLPVLMPMV